MMESGYFNNGNFREYCYFAGGGGFCSIETGIPGGPELNPGMKAQVLTVICQVHVLCCTMKLYK